MISGQNLEQQSPTSFDFISIIYRVSQKRFDSFKGKLFIGPLISLDFLNIFRGIQRSYKYISGSKLFELGHFLDKLEVTISDFFVTWHV